MKPISHAAFAQCQSSIYVGSQSQCPTIYSLALVCVSDSATISF
jgi:hypothetical protein